VRNSIERDKYLQIFEGARFGIGTLGNIDHFEKFSVFLYQQRTTINCRL
jgi:hypothetical protein